MPEFTLRLLERATPLFFVAVAGLLFFAIRLYRRTEPPVQSRMRTFLFALRVASIASLAFLLLDPVLSRLRERRVPPRVPVLLDASLSMSLPFPDSSSAMTPGSPVPSRSDRLADALAGEGASALEDLGQDGKVEILRFGEGTTPLGWVEPREELAPTDDRTDLAQALSRAAGDDASSAGAIVVFSDGANNVGEDPRALARRLGVPVIAIGVGADGPVSDVSVFEVEASTVAYIDNDVPVVAKLRARGDAITGAIVRLVEGNTVLDSTRVDLPGGGVEREVRLKYVPKREGMHRYKVETPARSGEVSPANNTQMFAVRVLKEKMKVLLVAGRPSFELTFLKRALESDVSLDVTPVVLSLERFPGRLGAGGPSFPDSESNLAAYDLVVLLDVAGREFEESRASRLARFVTERGGALFVLGGARAFDLSTGPLAGVVPFVTPSATRSYRGPILAGLTDVGRSHPVTRLETDADSNARIWADLPPLEEAPRFSSTSPQARVLVEGEGGSGASGAIPLVASVERGKGRVLAWAGGPYWRWDLDSWGRGRSGDPYRKLVSRAVRWLVSRDALKQVMIRASRTLYDGAEPVVLQGQVLDDEYRPIPGADVRVTVRGPVGAAGESSREISLVDLGDGRFEGKIPSLPPGDYVFEGRAKNGEVALGEDRGEWTVTPYRMELENPAPDFELLREVARASGGTFLRFDEIDKLKDAVSLQPVVQRSVRESPIGESPWAFAALLGFLGTEWALRKRRGLP